jgi:hypothetical protein
MTEMPTRNLTWGRDPVSNKLDAKIYSGSRTGWGLDAGHYQGYIDSVAVHPRPDSETSQYARHRINAVGQRYRIPVVVGHGAWPFRYELLTAPAGATIGQTLTLSGNSLVAGADYGVVEWSNPTAGTHSFTVLVVDQNGVKTILTWTLVVSDSNWVYLDPAAGTNGTGTLASPFNTIASLNGLTNKGVLIRAGSVDWQNKATGLQNMPKTYVPYGNESVTHLQATSSIGNNGGDDLWFSGATFSIPSNRTDVNQFFRIEGMSRVVFFENTFNGGNYNNTSGAASNSSVLMWANQGVAESSVDNAWYCVVKNNTFLDVADRDLILAYSMRHAVVEGNTLTSCAAGSNGLGHGFYFKINSSNVTIRSNKTTGTTNTATPIRIDAYAGQFKMDYYDICYNNFYFSGSTYQYHALSFAHEFVSCGTHRYAYRNTIVSPNKAAAYCRGMASGDIVTVDSNIFISNEANTNGILFEQNNATVNNTNYLAGNVAAGIVDSNNKLQGVYLSNLGTSGAEII